MVNIDPEIDLNNRVWYYKVFNCIINRALSRGLDKNVLSYYTEKHHILPKCMGGENNDNNYVLLTAKEHILIHMILYRLYFDNNQYNKWLCFAVFVMLNSKNKKRYGRFSLRTAAYYREQAGKFQKDKIISETQKIKISEAKKGSKLGSPSIEHRKKISDSKKGNQLGNEVQGPDGLIYPTVKNCAEAYGTTIGMIQYWIKKRPDKGFKYTGNHTKIDSGRRKPVIGPDGTVYSSVKEACDATGHDRHTIADWIRHNPDKGWKYA